MGVFFLHIATHNQIREQYPAIYERKTDGNKSPLTDVGFEAWTMAVAKSGIAGTVESVNAMKLWDFWKYLTT